LAGERAMMEVRMGGEQSGLTLGTGEEGPFRRGGKKNKAAVRQPRLAWLGGPFAENTA